MEAPTMMVRAEARPKPVVMAAVRSANCSLLNPSGHMPTKVAPVPAIVLLVPPVNNIDTVKQAQRFRYKRGYANRLTKILSFGTQRRLCMLVNRCVLDPDCQALYCRQMAHALSAGSTASDMRDIRLFSYKHP